MNPLYFYTKIYGSLECKNVPYWLLTPIRRLVRKLANKHIPRYFKNNKPQFVKGLFVSFTSFPARIDNVWKVVESLKNQTVMPEKIILWLSKEQFPDEESLPQSLLSERDALFEIRLVDGDIRSHKKYFYTLREYADKSFITCDDDVFYDPNMIRRLVEASRLFPGCVIANHTHKLVFESSGEISSYMNFVGDIKPYSSDNLIQIGIGGVLYPPHCLHEMVIEQDLFMRLAPLADDIWLNVMARLKGTPIVQSSKDVLSLPVVDGSPSLSDVNNGENRNNQQITQIREYLKSKGLEDIYNVKCDIRSSISDKYVTKTIGANNFKD